MLLDSITQTKFASLSQNPQDPSEHLLTVNDNVQVAINTQTLRIDVRRNGSTVLSVNSRNLFYFEHLRNREDGTNTISGINMENTWEETFGGETDRRPNG